VNTKTTFYDTVLPGTALSVIKCCDTLSANMIEGAVNGFLRQVPGYLPGVTYSSLVEGQIKSFQSYLKMFEEELAVIKRNALGELK
jgi:hypothetical protein